MNFNFLFACFLILSFLYLYFNNKVLYLTFLIITVFIAVPKVVALFNNTAYPIISVQKVLVVIMTAILLRNKKFYLNPLKWPIIFYFIMVLPSIIVNPLSSIEFFSNFLTIFIPPLFLLNYLNYDNVPRVVDFTSSLIIMTCVYGLFTVIVSDNFIINFITESVPKNGHKLLSNYSEREAAVRSLRLQSFINHPIRFGFILAMFLPLYILILFRRKSIKDFIFAFFSILCLLLVNSRSPILFLLVSLLIGFAYSSIDYKWKLTRVFALLMPIGVLIITVTKSNYLIAVRALIDSSVDAGGSSSDMRSKQLVATFNVLKNDLIFGKGFDATQEIVRQDVVTDLYGAESWLFGTLIDYGMWGVFFGLLFFFQFFKALSFKNSKNSSLSRNIRGILIGTSIGYFIFILLTGEMDTLGIFLIGQIMFYKIGLMEKYYMSLSIN